MIDLLVESIFIAMQWQKSSRLEKHSFYSNHVNTIKEDTFLCFSQEKTNWSHVADQVSVGVVSPGSIDAFHV